MTETFIIHQRPAPRTAGFSRRVATVSLIVVHFDPAPAEAALARFTARGARVAPHFYVAADGTLTQLVDEERAARHSGLARLGRRRNVDRISVGVTVEGAPGEALGFPQLRALHWLLGVLQRRHGLLADAALVRWEPPLPGEPLGALLPLDLPPAPPPPAPALLDPAAAQRLSAAVDAGAAAQQQLWVVLQGEAARQRGATYGATAFALHAARHDCGAPLGPSSPRDQWLKVGGRTYNYQHFGRDTLFNEGEQWQAVQSLAAQIKAGLPAQGTPAFELLKSAYATGVGRSKPTTGKTDLNPGWAFHRLAAEQQLGPALSGNYSATLAGQQVSVQVFAGDTLYAPGGGSQTKRLSEEPPGALREALWAETYRPCGAAYRADSPLQQAAAAARVGAPLSGEYQVGYEGASLTVQVFALDTLFQIGGGPVRRQSALAKPADVQAWQPKPAAAASAAAPAAAPAQTVARPVARPAGGFPVPPGDQTSQQWPSVPAGLKPLVTAAQRQSLFGAYQFVHAPGRDPDQVKITDGWEADNIVRVQIPQLAGRGIAGAPADGVVRWHRLAVQQLLDMWAAWEDEGLLPRVIIWNGAYNPRFKRGSKRASADDLSNHAFGTAFDINFDPKTRLNDLGVVPALVGQRGCVRELVAIANHFGFFWGGHFPVRLDGMHFEVAQLRG